MRKYKRGAKKFKKVKSGLSDFDFEMLRPMSYQQYFDNVKEAMNKMGWYCTGYLLSSEKMTKLD